MLPAPLADLLICLRFFSRLPLPTSARETALESRGLAAAVVMVPAAGAGIGIGPALVLVAASAVGLPPLVAAPLALLTLIVLTGALHEDGLADCADGFGGGRTRDRKLEIMRDSRIGTFGACAIGLSLYLRAASLTVLAARDVALAVAVLVAGAAVSRALCLLPLVLLPAARRDGAGASVAPLSLRRYGVCLILAAAVSTIPLLAHGDLAHVVAADGSAGGMALVCCVIARRAIGGQTGDVAGATQQVTDLTIMLAFAAGA